MSTDLNGKESKKVRKRKKVQNKHSLHECLNLRCFSVGTTLHRRTKENKNVKQEDKKIA